MPQNDAALMNGFHRKAQREAVKKQPLFIFRAKMTTLV